MKILLVDDDATITRVASMSLSKAGHQVSVAASGEEALALALKDPPELILLDVAMPGIDGYETCRRLKWEDATKDLPVIFLSAMTQADQQKKGLAAGALGYLTKPFDPLSLAEQVRKIYDGAKSRGS